MAIITLLARLALAHAPVLLWTWFLMGFAFTGVERIIATLVWAVIGTAGVRLAMRLSFAIAHLLGAMGL